MLSIVDARRRRLCAELLAAADAAIGFADVGSGGPLKRPWSLLPAGRLQKFDFEPTAAAGGEPPLCVSNRDGLADFHIARDERASSFHRALPEFAARYAMQSLLATRTIQVRSVTLDGYFAGRHESVDALDVNVEGHDLQVLEGAALLLENGALKLLKIEFELTAVWEGQGWLSDIDPLLRGCGFELAGIDIEFARPASVRRCFHRGEPLWGKALYAPGKARWLGLLARAGSDTAAAQRAVAQGMALYIAADLPGRALDLLELRPPAANGSSGAESIRARIEGVYRWAKWEQGARELHRLAARAVGAQGPSNP